MHHFRLNIIFTAVALIIASVALGMLVTSAGYVLLKALLVLSILGIAVRLLMIVRRLIHQMSFFVNALSSKDFMIRFPKSDDSELCEMFNAMNEIAEKYRRYLSDLETKRHYYDRILKIMSHELRNSITPIVALTDDMLKRPQVYQGESLHEGLEVINGQCVGMKRFLDSYYEMTHLPQPQKTFIDVRQMLAHVRQLFAQEMQKPEHQNVDLRFSFGMGMTIDADESMINQVLINLITNALQATAETEHPLIEIMASTPNGKPCITVTDNGTGIADDIKDDIFQPFFTTHANGTGIGLCISRQIMRLHGGDLTVTSRVGRGAEFMMVFG